MPKTILVLISIFFLSCSSRETGGIAEHYTTLPNLTVIPADIQPKYSVQFIREAIYGSSNDIIIGPIGTITVDESGRVYISAGETIGILVFETDGHYLAQIGRNGRGPGEFMHDFPAIHISSNRLYAIDLVAHRINIFSLESFQLIRTFNINTDSEVPSLDNYYISHILSKNDGTFLAGYKRFLSEVPGLPDGTKIDTLSIHYYSLSEKGNIGSDGILEIKQQPVVVGSFIGAKGPVSFNFFSKPLITISDAGTIYVTQSNNFLIKEYNKVGKYQRAFFHPFTKVELSREAVAENQRDFGQKMITLRGSDQDMVQMMMNNRLATLRKMDLPLDWPALNDLLVDDHNRLWVSTIVENFDVYEWWVLEHSGELITKFEWPRNEPIEVVKNGYIYTRETDEETGLQQVVRYRIAFDEVN